MLKHSHLLCWKELTASLQGERHSAGNSVPGLFLTGQNHCGFGDLIKSPSTTSAVLCTINTLYALMSKSRLFQSTQLGGIYLSSIMYTCILFTSPNHLGNWQVNCHMERQSTQKSQGRRSKSRELAFKCKTAFKKTPTNTEK